MYDTWGLVAKKQKGHLPTFAKHTRTNCAPDALSALLSPLVQLAVTEEHPHTQQLALLAVRQIARHLADPSLLAEAAAAFTLGARTHCVYPLS